MSLLLDDLADASFPRRSPLIRRLHYWALEENCPHHPTIVSLIQAHRAYYPSELETAALYYSALREQGESLGECGTSVHDEDDVVLVDNSFPDRLFVCFAGVGRKFLGLSWNVANEYFVKRSRANLLVLRDNFRLRYLAGVESLGKGSFRQSVDALNRLLRERCGSAEVTFIGSSMGTYGALLYSHFLPCERVVCLGGRTRIATVVNSLEVADQVIDTKIRALAASPSFVSEHADFASLVDIAANLRPASPSCRYFYLCGGGNVADVAAGQDLKAAVPDATLVMYDTHRHTFMPEELKAGFLSAVLQ